MYRNQVECQSFLANELSMFNSWMWSTKGNSIMSLFIYTQRGWRLGLWYGWLIYLTLAYWTRMHVGGSANFGNETQWSTIFLQNWYLQPHQTSHSNVISENAFILKLFVKVLESTVKWCPANRVDRCHSGDYMRMYFIIQLVEAATMHMFLIRTWPMTFNNPLLCFLSFLSLNMYKQ